MAQEEAAEKEDAIRKMSELYETYIRVGGSNCLIRCIHSLSQAFFL